MQRLIILTLLISFFSISVVQSELFNTNSYHAQINHVKNFVSGDINGDMLPDLLVVTDHDDGVIIYLNAGSNQFYLAKNQVQAKGAKDALLVDLDRDGDLDLRVTSLFVEGQDSDEVYLNNGQGVFENFSFQIFSDQVANNSVDLLSADLTNDGHQNTIRISKSDENELLSFYIYIINDQGRIEITTPQIEHLDAIDFADFNDDGYLDIWSLGAGLTVFLNDGNGSFSDVSKVEVNQSFIGLGENSLLADIDNDGDTDIQTFSTDFYLPRYINNGDGTFSLPNVVPYLNNPGQQLGLFLDVDNDQDFDLWFAHNKSNLSKIAFTDENGVVDLNVNTIDLDENQIQALVADDFDNDGDVDVATVGFDGVNVWQREAEASMFTYVEQVSVNLDWGRGSQVSVVDMNGDGILDAVLAGLSGVKQALGNGRGSITSLSAIHDEVINYYHAQDLNADGFADLVIINDEFQVKLLENDQTGSFLSTSLPVNMQQPYIISSGDIDQDGDIDLAIMEFYGSIEIFMNQGDNQFDKIQTIKGGFRTAKLVDLNQNGEFQLIAANLLTSFGEPLRGVIQYDFDGAGFNKTREVEQFGLISLFVFYDHDADGDLDILIGNRGENSWGDFDVLVNEADALEVSSLPFRYTDPAHIADINHDQFLDVITANGDVFLGSNSGFVPPKTISARDYGGSVVLIDLDGDTDLDKVQFERKLGLSTSLNNTIDIDFSGSWYNPQQNGHGIQVEQVFLNGSYKSVVSWYVYHNGEQVWLTGSGDVVDNYSTVQLYITSGPNFGSGYDVNDLNVQLWGTVTMSLTGANQMNFQWDGSSLGYSQGELDFVRFVAIKPVSKTLQSINSCHSGSWFDPSKDGQGFMAQVVDVGGNDHMLMTWYTYNNGQQYWLTGLGPIEGNKATLSVQATTGANFPPAFEDSDVVVIQWGEIDFELSDDNHAVISWRPVLDGFSADELSVQRLTQIDRYICQ